MCNMRSQIQGTDEMKPRSLAVAMLGWYLLTPPVYTEGPDKGQIAFDSPFPRWQQHGAFDSAGECERARAKLEAKGHGDLRKLGEPRSCRTRKPTGCFLCSGEHAGG